MFFLSLVLLSIYLFLISPTDAQPSCESVCSSPNSWNVLLERADCFGDGHAGESSALASASVYFAVIYRFHLRPAILFSSQLVLMRLLKIKSLQRGAHASLWASDLYGRVVFLTARVIAHCLAQGSASQPEKRTKASTRSSAAPLPGELEEVFSSFHHNIFTSVRTRVFVCVWLTRSVNPSQPRRRHHKTLWPNIWSFDMLYFLTP